ncbi:hypothetical protein AAHE18_07G173700 [Arachis hypogaea]
MAHFNQVPLAAGDSIAIFSSLNIRAAILTLLTEAGTAARNFLSHISPHSATVELLSPPTHSQLPGTKPQTELPRPSAQYTPFLHLRCGCASLKIVTNVLCASNIHANETTSTCKIWDNPSEPT